MATTIIDKVQLLNGSVTNLPTLSLGEPALTTDEERFYMGGINGNISFPNQSDVNTLNTNINNANTVANEANITSIQALTNSNSALTTAKSAQNQVANIITSNGSGKDSELVDIRTDANGTVWDSAGDHVRNLDKNYEISKVVYTYTSTADGTTSIPIQNTTVDLTNATFQFNYYGVNLTSNMYTINTTSKTINLVGWVLNNGYSISYQIYP
ncbi:hypothetical protein [Clostridium sp.]|uniref:hypothetical protein n=1 Tax=Clostridium sp. TaxID=1506 RepID=UPI002624596C|nr:hypothetical protein [Clostridium sp.]